VRRLEPLEFEERESRDEREWVKRFTVALVLAIRRPPS